MATENTEKTQERTKKYAMEVEKELKSLHAEEGPRWWREAELIWEVHDKSLWQILGHDNVGSYVETLFISKSGWYKKRRLWGEWSKIALERDAITRARLNRMPQQNVEHLIKLDERRKFSQPWIEKALNMKESDFEAAVDAVLEKGDDGDDEDQPETRSVLKINCALSQKAFILESMAAFAKRQDPPLELDNEAKILELMCADMRAGLDQPMDGDLRAWVAAGRPGQALLNPEKAQVVAAGGRPN